MTPAGRSAARQSRPSWSYAGRVAVRPGAVSGEEDPSDGAAVEVDVECADDGRGERNSGGLAALADHLEHAVSVDDEPLDDARTVAMTAAAAAARVIETAPCQAQEKADRDRAQVERRTEEAQAEAALRTLSGPSWDAQRPEREAARQNLTSETREAFRVADLSTGIDPAPPRKHHP